MRCFNHPDVEAVGICKHCSKGICKECVEDSGHGIACSFPCVSEIRSLYAAISRNKKVYSIAAKAGLRNAIWFFLLGGIFFAFAVWTEIKDSPFMMYLFGMGALMIVAGVFALVNSRKMARLSVEDGVVTPSRGATNQPQA